MYKIPNTIFFFVILFIILQKKEPTIFKVGSLLFKIASQTAGNQFL